LHSPSTKLLKLLSGFNLGSTCNFFIPGIINGFLIDFSSELNGTVTGLLDNSAL